MKDGITLNQRIAIEAIKRQSSLTIIFESGERLVFTGKRICHEIALALQAECIRRNKVALKRLED